MTTPRTGPHVKPARSIQNTRTHGTRYLSVPACTDTKLEGITSKDHGAEHTTLSYHPFRIRQKAKQRPTEKRQPTCLRRSSGVRNYPPIRQTLLSGQPASYPLSPVNHSARVTKPVTPSNGGRRAQGGLLEVEVNRQSADGVTLRGHSAWFVHVSAAV